MGKRGLNHEKREMRRKWKKEHKKRKNKGGKQLMEKG
jgi:hypothetical protein